MTFYFKSINMMVFFLLKQTLLSKLIMTLIYAACCAHMNIRTNHTYKITKDKMKVQLCLSHTKHKH